MRCVGLAVSFTHWQSDGSHDEKVDWLETQTSSLLKRARMSVRYFMFWIILLSTTLVFITFFSYRSSRGAVEVWLGFRLKETLNFWYSTLFRISVHAMGAAIPHSLRTIDLTTPLQFYKRPDAISAVTRDRLGHIGLTSRVRVLILVNSRHVHS